MHRQSAGERFMHMRRGRVSVWAVARLVLHSLRGFPVTDFAAHLPLRLRVVGRLRSTAPGRYWFCTVDPPVTCTLADGVERDHIHPELLSADRSAVHVSALVLTPAVANRVLQPGVVDFPVHVAAVLDPSVQSGTMHPDQVGYLGCAIVDDADIAGTSQSVLEQQIQALPTRW